MSRHFIGSGQNNSWKHMPKDITYCQTMNEFSKKLSQLMADRGVNQVVLAQKSQIDQSMISKYLRNLVQPTLPAIHSLARALKCTLEELTGFESTKGIEQKAETVQPAAEDLKLLEAIKRLPADSPKRKLVEQFLLERDTNMNNSKQEDDAK